MKPRSMGVGSALLILTIAVSSFALMSFRGEKTGQGNFQEQFANDTVPDRKARNLDDVLRELESVDLKLEMESVQKSLAEAMKELDEAKISAEIEQAMRAVDMEKIMKEVEESLAKVDMKEIQRQLAETMKEVDSEKVRAEIEKSMKEIDLEKMEKELKESLSKMELKKEFKVEMKEMEESMKKARKELEAMGPKMEKELQKAREGLEKAKADLKELKGFVDDLEKDGLLKKSDGFTIEHKDGKLTVNGKQVSDETYRKYSKFLEKHKKFEIKQTKDDIDVDMD